VRVRDTIAARLGEDLLGPQSEREELDSKPTDVYLTGLLWPPRQDLGVEVDDDRVGFVDNEEPIGAPSLIGQARPSSMGVSFACVSEGIPRISIAFECGVYDHDPETQRWTRTPVIGSCDFDLEPGTIAKSINLTTNDDTGFAIDLYLRATQSGSKYLVTATAINRSQVPEDLTFSEQELAREKCVAAQTKITVSATGETRFIPRNPGVKQTDPEVESARLLYREHYEFASGHNCSASWDSSGNRATSISSEWLPTVEVPAFSDLGDDVFTDLVSSGRLGAERLSSSSSDEIGATLRELVACYQSWLAIEARKVDDLPEDLRQIGASHIQMCEHVALRMSKGVEFLVRDPQALEAFRFANAAMALQHSWKKDPQGAPLSPLTWRPFQLGFILLSVASTCLPEDDDREVLDLLWFPTGGGKTEAYLALIGIVAWYRRLTASTPAEGDGNVAVMRYTLRLLTAQQFERASALILACELIRLGRTAPRENLEAIGVSPFSIGLWVGGDATPNTVAKIGSGKSNPDQLEHCFACGGMLTWSLERSPSYRPRCSTEDCILSFDAWPVATIDEDIYALCPTLLIGTIDKFAQLPFQVSMGKLFGFGSSKSTDLIVQDELHLISGPLGSIAGIYEIAFDWLLRKGKNRAKVIGSTATIRRATAQVRALFDRESCQFPPPGLTSTNSGFAVVDENRPGRLYVGVTSLGRSPKFALQAAVASVLQSASVEAGLDESSRNPYSTLLMYFHSLRELGGAVVQVLDDVPDTMGPLAARRGEKPRALHGQPAELTSRYSQLEIVEILRKLQLDSSDPDSVDTVLATNMVSVGVDVSRLGLMVMQGMPKSRAEYIQASSRVGRTSAAPGLIVAMMNASKARDLSAFESFLSWHGAIYRDVEPTSVTPFAPRAREKALHAVLVSMVRHSLLALRDKPYFSAIPQEVLIDVVTEIERRVAAIDPAELRETTLEIDRLLDFWEQSNRIAYYDRKTLNQSLLQSAEDRARRHAMGRAPHDAWPTMNSMRTVEASTLFRMTNALSRRASGDGAGDVTGAETTTRERSWRTPS
jgi:hypothetical protein